MDLCQENNNYEKNINENSLVMNGNNVFKFSVHTVPKIIKKLMKNKVNLNKVQYFFLHQARKIVNSNIQRLLNIRKNKFINAYQDYGNTVSSSIPLVLKKKFKNLKKKKVIMCGFGVGLSVAACFHEFK
jgi:3-oxoacyl-[acyl-carrier-protein] synthase-3